MLTPQWLDQLRARITLSALIGRTVRLQKAGNEFKACCPFHNEKTPSFHVNDAKGFYHCFGCSAHGDAIRWLTDHQGLAFMDAVKELAAEAGMAVPAPDPRAAKAAEKRDTLHDVTAAAQDWFVASLAAPEGAEARAYLTTRGFDAHTVQRFGFGFAPEGRQALKGALARFPEAMLIEAGLRIAVEDKEPYDRFRGRLMLPIEDARGRTIAFGGRILAKGKTDAPKYLNSPDTPLFDKGRTLYNLHRAAPAARQSGRMIVVEGYMDVIALAAAGIGECVAPLGTALTEQQIEMLWRHVETPILCFDGDAAGQRAAMRAVTRALPLLKPAHSLRIVWLPEGLDPDDLIKTGGRSAFEGALQESSSLIDTLWRYERDLVALETPEDKAGLKDRLLKNVEQISNGDIKQLYRRQLLTKYSDFVFPKRDWSVHGPAVVSFDREKSSRARDLFLAKVSVRDAHLYNRLGAAIAAGFMLRPNELPKYAEDLDTVHHLDPRSRALIDAFHEGVPLSHETLVTILSAEELSAPTPDEFDFLRFPFAWPGASDARAAATMRKAVRLYTEIPRAKEALSSAQQRYEDNLTRTTEEDKRRLQSILEELWRELKTFNQTDWGE